VGDAGGIVAGNVGDKVAVGCTGVKEGMSVSVGNAVSVLVGENVSVGVAVSVSMGEAVAAGVSMSVAVAVSVSVGGSVTGGGKVVVSVGSGSWANNESVSNDRANKAATREIDSPVQNTPFCFCITFFLPVAL
jgi:hypothetical protein